jgi:hypothetical protein
MKTEQKKLDKISDIFAFIRRKWGKTGITEIDSGASSFFREQIRKEWTGALRGYSAKSVKECISDYQAFVDDKHNPKPPALEDITARLRKIEKDEAPPLGDADRLVEPTTSINNLKSVFYNVFLAGHQQGVYNSSWLEKVKGIPCGVDMYVREIRLENGIVDRQIHRHKWDWNDALGLAKSKHPDQFGLYPFMNINEEYALAHLLGFLKI